ncbi:hypothetical protein Tco_0566903 [Tanacetum coccineum]
MLLVSPDSIPDLLLHSPSRASITTTHLSRRCHATLRLFLHATTAVQPPLRVRWYSSPDMGVFVYVAKPKGAFGLVFKAPRVRVVIAPAGNLANGHPTAVLFDDDTWKDFLRSLLNTKEYRLNVLANITMILRRIGL